MSKFAFVLVMLTSLLITRVSHADEVNNADNKYPDVWHWQAPDGVEVTNLRAFSLSNGDVLLSYDAARKNTYGKIKKSTYIPMAKETHVLELFFSREVLTEKISSYEMAAGIVKSVRLSNGATVDIVGEAQEKILTSDDSTISYIWPGKPCHYLNWLRSFEQQRGTKLLWRRYVYWVLDTPDIISSGDPDECPGQYHPKIRRRVISLAGEMLPLSDGTFLVLLGNQLVVRFDKELRTKSSLLNRKLFVVDLDPKSIMRRMSGRDYDSYKGINDQAAMDDIYTYLMTIKNQE